jgi:thiol-disulfide isomerase/thioredoxin
MICIIALVVFSFLGIVSATHRKIALQAFDCVFRRITLRPCQSGLDRRLKVGIIGFVSRRNVKAAKVVARHFELLSWTFTIIMILSLVFTVRGIYYYAVYGNCNGQNSNAFCIYDALNPKDKESTVCSDPSIPIHETRYTRPTPEDDPSVGPTDAKVTIIEFGCYACPFTKQAEPTVKEILKKYAGKVLFVYRDFHIPAHEGSDVMAMASECADEQGRFWEYHDGLFDLNGPFSYEALYDLANRLKLNETQFRLCLDSNRYAPEVDKDFKDGVLAGVQGTPTFFINDQVVVGTKPIGYFTNIIDKELKKV